MLTTIRQLGKLSRMMGRAMAAAALLLATNTSAEEEDRDAKVLAALGIDADAEGIRAYLSTNGHDEKAAAAAEALFEKLRSDEFIERQKAQRALEAMPKVPEAVLKQALKSDDPEVVVLARRLIPKKAADELAGEIGAFVCMRRIAQKKLGGFVPEILANVQRMASPPTRSAAIAALTAAARAEDAELFEEAAKSENERVRAAAEGYLEWRRSGREEAPPLASWDEFFAANILRGKGEGGHKTEFVKGVPRKVQACFGKHTKTANTMGAVTDRPRISPWLYPDKNWGEIPKVLVKGGERHYPLWGTWQQQWSAKTIRLNENGSLLNPPHSAHNNIHASSTVDFIVVPISE